MNDEQFPPNNNKPFQSLEQETKANIPNVIEKMLLFRKARTLRGESIQVLKEEGRR